MIYLLISIIYLPYLDRQTQISFKLIVMAARKTLTKPDRKKPGTTLPILCQRYVGILTSLVTSPERMQEKGPTTVYRPYSRRLKCPAICRCHSKGSTFSSVTLRPWALVLSEGWTLGLLHGSPGHSTSWANKAAVKCAMKKKSNPGCSAKQKETNKKRTEFEVKKINKTFRNFSVQPERLASSHLTWKRNTRGD